MKVGKEINEKNQAELYRILSVVDGPEQEYANPEFEAEFDEGWEYLDLSLDQAMNNESGAKETQAVEKAADSLIAKTEKMQIVEIGAKTEKELQIWNVEQGRQRMESMGRFAKKGISKAGDLLKNFFSGKIGNGLESFGRTMRDLGYGTASVVENLPKAAVAKMSEGVKAVARESVFAYKKVAIEVPNNYKKAKKGMEMWQEKRTEKKEQKEFEKLKVQWDRYQELRKKFEALE